MPISEVTNRNFQSPLNFEFRVDRLTDFNFFVQKINIPALSLSPATNGGTNPFTKIYYPGDHMDFGELTVDFKVNEGMENWYEIFYWIQSLGYPQSTEQYARLKAGEVQGIAKDVLKAEVLDRKVGKIYGQASLFVNTSQNNPAVKFSFVDIHPTNLSETVFDTRDQDVMYVTSTVTFRYDYFTVEKVV